MLCEGRNRASLSAPNSQEKPFKIGCLMPIKKLDTVEVDKPKEERCDDKSENKKNTDQKLQEYLELKNGKKFKSGMMHVWKTV